MNKLTRSTYHHSVCRHTPNRTQNHMIAPKKSAKPSFRQVAWSRMNTINASAQIARLARMSTWESQGQFRDQVHSPSPAKVVDQALREEEFGIDCYWAWTSILNFM